jgi:small redox-active disulfide protein 2
MEESNMNIKVLGGGCCKCENLLEAVKEAVAEKGVDAEIEYITDMARIMEYGIMSTPALMIDNKIVSMGRVLKTKDVLRLLR